MIEYLAIAYFGLSVFDAWITRKRIISYGPQVEGNQIIRDIATKMGPDTGVAVGILLPTVLLTLLLVALNAPILLAGLIGYRIRMFVNQVQSLAFEKEARRIKDSINKSSGG